MTTSLLSLLSYGSSSIQRTNSSISTTAGNLGNVNTEGYSRQRTDDRGNAVRIADNLLSRQIHSAAGALSGSQTSAGALSDLEADLTSGGTLDGQLGNLFAKLSTASATPTDSGARNAVLASARALATGVQQRSAQVGTAQRDTDQRIRDGATSVTSLANQLAAANAAVAKSGDPAALDQRDKVAKQLGQLVGGQARIDADGQLRYTLDGGAVLVDGTHAASLTATADPTTGLAQLGVVDGNATRDVTAAITGGSVGANLAFRDRTLAGVQAQLDQVAYDVTTSFNAVHAAHAGLDGATGRNLFVPLTQVAGAAQKIALDPAIDADPSKLALATPGAGPGDNAGALALFALGDQKVASGGSKTLGDAAIDVVAGVAQASADAKAQVTSQGLIASHLDGLRDSLSGVDSQEEMTNLARFQNASSAMTKVVSTINDMLSSLIDAL
ncbi:MAG TPA: flagellar hook-associated protein FlgK [Kofleriaceae bacterium]|nr:flagellar hook-associated protein FlgK [Kofleriaceae bacterium]